MTNEELFAEMQNMMKMCATILTRCQSMHEQTSQMIAQNEREMNAALQQMKNEVKQTTQESQKNITEDTKMAVREGLESEMPAFRQELKGATNDIHNAFDHYASERKRLAAQTKILGWKTIILSSIALGIIIASTLGLSWNEKQKRDSMVAEYQAAKVGKDMLTAENRMIKTKCGDQVCIKVDTNAGKWGENGEYAIPVLKD